LFTGLLVVVGFVTAGFICWQSLESRRAAQAATKSIQITINKERPRITVELDNPVLDMKDPPPRVRCKFDCWCPTPAFYKQGEIETFIEGRIPRISNPLPIWLSPFIRTNVTEDTWTIIFEEPMQETVDGINAGRLILYCRGFVEYRGVHLDDDSPSYKTTFSYKWSPAIGESFLGYVGQWEKEGKNENT
jgi:hypothetical protein